MDAVVETLFLAVEAGVGAYHQKKTIFLGARYHPVLRFFDGANLVLQQHFKPYEIELKREGMGVHTQVPERLGDFDLALVLLPKNMIEARRVVAQGLLMLGDGGVFLCAADNKAGGQRIAGILREFGLKELQQFSKNRARAVCGVCSNINRPALEAALLAGDLQSIALGGYYSQPGLFAWDKIDKGSALLAAILPEDIEGVCGDFGCGYGYLSRIILESRSGVREIVCVDADYRAVQACEKNLNAFPMRKRFMWEDLSRDVKSLRELDIVVMNPPFHEGRTTEIDLGRGFIAAAYAALRPGGRLFMVANRHLPYEDLLRELFSSSEKLFEGEGYKIYAAIR